MGGGEIVDPVGVRCVSVPSSVIVRETVLVESRVWVPECVKVSVARLVAVLVCNPLEVSVLLWVTSSVRLDGVKVRVAAVVRDSVASKDCVSVAVRVGRRVLVDTVAPEFVATDVFESVCESVYSSEAEGVSVGVSKIASVRVKLVVTVALDGYRCDILSVAVAVYVNEGVIVTSAVSVPLAERVSGTSRESVKDAVGSRESEKVILRVARSERLPVGGGVMLELSVRVTSAVLDEDQVAVGVGGGEMDRVRVDDSDIVTSSVGVGVLLGGGVSVTVNLTDEVADNELVREDETANESVA